MKWSSKLANDKRLKAFRLTDISHVRVCVGSSRSLNLFFNKTHGTKAPDNIRNAQGGGGTLLIAV